MKKFIALFLIFSFAVLSGNLVAQEWKRSFSLKAQKANEGKYGFTLSTQKTTEQHIMEKFTPKEKNSILLLEPKFETDVSFPSMNNINIGESKSSRFWTGLLYGTIIAFGNGDDKDGLTAFKAEQKALYGAVIGFVVGGIIGGVIEAKD